MKKRLISAAAALALCLTACTPVNEDVAAAESGESAIYISPEAENTASAGSYVRSFLTEEEKQAYDSLVEAVNNYEPLIIFPEGFDEAAMKKIFTLVYTQENRIFWLDSKFYCDGETRTINLFYRYNKDEAGEMRAVLDLAAGKILGSVPEGSSDYEKILIFHDAIVLGCDFSKEGKYSNTAYGALVDGSAQCEGYAFALSYLCSSAGIENYVVQGSSKEGASHAWNKVLANGKWYNTDCTWDDPILKYENPDYLRHDYFLVSDAEINGRTHFPDESLFPPAECTASDRNYFIMNGLMFITPEEGEKGLSEAVRLAASAGKTEAEIRFDNKEAYDAANEHLFAEDGFKKIIEDLNGNYGLKIKSAHKTVNDSMYIIHISLVF